MSRARRGFSRGVVGRGGRFEVVASSHDSYSSLLLSAKSSCTLQYRVFLTSPLGRSFPALRVPVPPRSKPAFKDLRPSGYLLASCPSLCLRLDAYEGRAGTDGDDEGTW